MLTDAEAVSQVSRILVADDQQDVLEALRLLLKGAGYRPEIVNSPAALLLAAGRTQFDLILMDLNYTRDTTSGHEGLELLSSLQAQGVSAPVVVMTAWSEVELAVEAMRRGACDFVQKPWDNQRLLTTIGKQTQAAWARREAEQRARSEWEIARAVQQKLLPQRTKTLATVAYAGNCLPAREIGGDYYDFLDAGDESLGVLLADVSGKGVPAALLMANLQALFRSQPSHSLRDPLGMIPSLNRLFYDSTPPAHYATLFFGVYEDRTRRLRFVNAGHPAPLLLRQGGHLERLHATATVVGLFPRWAGEEQSVVLHPGDRLVIFSDGVTEAANLQDEEFGEERLIALAKGHRGEALIAAVLDSVSHFGEQRHRDDCTVVVLEGLPS